MHKTITVVYQVNDPDTAEAQTLFNSIRDLFVSEPESESMPVYITASSSTDEMTKLELVSFYLECDDQYLAKKVIETDDISKHVEFFQSVREFADQNSVSISAAYEEVEFIA